MVRQAVAGFSLDYEAPEAGRYLAPILILPGLFQSFACWRSLSSSLAQRGWELYLLPRQPLDARAHPAQAVATIQDLTALTLRVARELHEKVIVFGADLGGHVALELAEELEPLALVLFCPCSPVELGVRYSRSLGLLRRLGLRAAPRSSRGLLPPASLRRGPIPEEWIEAEPEGLLEDLLLAAKSRPARGRSTAPRPRASESDARTCPTLLFDADGDPLVARDTVVAREGPVTKLARTVLAGRYWPAQGGQPLADEVHRFLILTLGDRVVEFPDSVFDDD